jgi:hypothetical protein
MRRSIDILEGKVREGQNLPAVALAKAGRPHRRRQRGALSLRAESRNILIFPVNTRYHADLPAWIAIGGISCLVLLLAYLDVFQSGKLTGYTILFVAASLLGFAWLLSFQIVLTPDEVIFRSLFRSRRALRNEEIKKVLLTHDFRRRREGPWQLIVEPRDHSMPDLRINAKVFPWAAIDAVLNRGAEVAEADDGGLREGVYLPIFRQLRKSDLSTTAILIGVVALLFGAVALASASLHSFETILFFWQDARRVVVEICIFGSSIFLLSVGNRLLHQHRWVQSMIGQLLLFVASFGFLGVMLYAWRAYSARQPHSATTYETVWFCVSLIGLVICTFWFRPRNKTRPGSTA